MPISNARGQNCISPEKVAYWYFRLNGFLQIENFIIHPGGKGSQRTDADLLGVRFPHRKEFLFDHGNPMKDDETNLGLSDEIVDVVISEVKSSHCTLNGPWTRPKSQNVNRLLAAIGCLVEADIGTAADQIYKTGAYRNERLRIRLVAIGNSHNLEIAKQYREVVQLTWDMALQFIWQRFHEYRKQKSDDQQWDQNGKNLKHWALIEAKSTDEFVCLVKSAMSVSLAAKRIS